jgi:Zn finger protein HypA/HybF involved in hydrogenase expression
MALTTFCATCQRTVYIEEEDTSVCPVCSSPLVAAVESPGEEEARREVDEQAAQQ